MPTARYPLVIRKVTAYVTRISEAGVPELLVFKPQDVGVQVPAGTVEEGESYEFAADREVAEETGLTSFERVRFLASIEVPLTDSSRAPVRVPCFIRNLLAKHLSTSKFRAPIGWR